MNQNPESNRFEEESRQAQAATKKLKKRMLIVLVIMVAFAAVAIPLIGVLEDLASGKDAEETQSPVNRPTSIIFAEPDYDANILEDEDYLALDRDIRLTTGNVTTTLDEKKIAGTEAGVQVLCQLIDAVIAGDAETYNSLFSERYYEKNAPEDPFTMQRLYDIKIIKLRALNVTSETEGTYSEYIYQLEYKINRNDGTYRTDVGHDSIRTQSFCLTDREERGVVKIDTLVYID